MMTLGDYRLLEQLAVNDTEVRYRALRNSDGSPVELVSLAKPIDDPSIFARICKRLRTIQFIQHHSCRRILHLFLESSNPFYVLDERTGLPVGFLKKGDIERALVLASDLSEGLEAGHRLGLRFGRFTDDSIRVREDGSFLLDWTGHTAEDADLSEDVKSLGIFLFEQYISEKCREVDWSRSEDHWVYEFGKQMTAPNPLDRPTMPELVRRLNALRSSIVATGAFQIDDIVKEGMTVGLGLPESVVGAMARLKPSAVVTLEEIETRKQLGRFRLEQKVGVGGMGAVYRATDISDGSTVAIKVLNPQWAQKSDALARFFKEARMLAEVNNPYVTNFVELNEDEGVHYLALEFVDSESLGSLLARENRLAERSALFIVADVAKGLVPVHERGIVHRDIKPANILVRVDENGNRHGKLTDFGLARHIDQSESLQMTQAGTLLGTPLYMSPEQCVGESIIDARSDVYSLGATLFHLLSGRPPFQAQTPMGLIAAHRDEIPVKLNLIDATLSEAVTNVVAKALAKQPDARYADASEFLEDLERLLRGEPTGIGVHPRLPQDQDVVAFDFSWDLESSPRQLWPHVSNTERLNRAAGWSSVVYKSEAKEEGGATRLGEIKAKGVRLAWVENPFEWVEARKMGVLREYTSGPFKWLASIVELEAKSGGGTRLTHKFRIAPHGLLGRTVAHLEIGRKGKKSLDGIYKRIDASATGKLGDKAFVDPFEDPPELTRERRMKLDRLLDTLVRKGIEPGTVEMLGVFLAQAPAQEIARIRPIVLAKRLGLPAEQVIAACLHGAVEGGLMLLWDLVCPLCRVPSQVLDTLKALRDHGHCEACAVDYELNFASSVEAIFRLHHEVRETDLAFYCVGGPAHMPHVIAQARIQPGERLALDLTLAEGRYRIRSPQLTWNFDFRVEPSPTAPRRLEIDLGNSPSNEVTRVLRSGGQVIGVTNATGHEIVLRVERTAEREDALTAAKASSLALFRELFPGEILSPGQLVNLARVTLLITELDASEQLYATVGDAKAFALVHEHFRRIEEIFRKEGGALIKTVHEGVVAAFSEPMGALKAALSLRKTLAENETTRGLGIKVGVHHGPAMVATLNDHLDYFGSTVRVAAGLPKLAKPGEVIVTSTVLTDPDVDAYLHASGLKAPVELVEIPGFAEGFVHRLTSP